MLAAASFILGCLALEAFLAALRLLYSLAGGITLGILCFLFLLRCGRLWDLAFRPNVGHVLVDLVVGFAVMGAFVSWISVTYGERVAAGVVTVAGGVGDRASGDACRQFEWAARMAGGTDGGVDCTATGPAQQARNADAARIQRYFNRMVWEVRLWIALPTLAFIAFAFGWTSSTAYRGLHRY
jgi:hypothetical protein